MEKGKVKFFDSREYKRFGFITVSAENGGGEIFFHYNDGYNFEAGDGDVPSLTGGRLEREPRRDDRVVFFRSHGRKGPKADPWCFADDYERAEKEIAARRTGSKIYRVLKHRNAGEEPTGYPKILWQGADIADLCERYPRTSNSLMDRLHPAFTLDLCGIEPAIWFERLNKDGWVQCDDPRPVEHGWRGDPYPLNTVIE